MPRNSKQWRGDVYRYNLGRARLQTRSYPEVPLNLPQAKGSRQIQTQSPIGSHDALPRLSMLEEVKALEL